MTAKKVKLIKKQRMSLQEYLHKLLRMAVMGGTDFIPLREVTHFEINNKHGLKDLSVFLCWYVKLKENDELTTAPDCRGNPFLFFLPKIKKIVT